MNGAIYNEIDGYAANWLENLIAEGLIAPGRVERRSIVDLTADDVRGSGQRHFFAGIGVWSHVMRRVRVPDDASVWTGSCPCFPAGTLVLTERGHVPIETVNVGDSVLTHRARWRRVTRIGSEIGDCVTLRGQGHWGLTCTPEHPFLVGDERWEAAADMAGKRWATIAMVPSSTVPQLPMTRGAFFDRNVGGFRAKGERNGKSIYVGLFGSLKEALTARARAARDGEVRVRGADGVDSSTLEFAKFLGYWVGDGWVTGDTVSLCGAISDGPMLERLMTSAGMSCCLSKERTSARARCGSRMLARWLDEHFGRGAAHKRIPAWLHGASEAYRAAFLDGYFTADGHGTRSPSGGSIAEFTTVSRALAVGVRVLLNQAGISASIGMTHSRRGSTVIEGRRVNELPCYQVTAYGKARSFKFTEAHGWGLVRSVEPAGTARVYNLSVEDDESYCADGIAVHNCQPFSDAGARSGVRDPRHLWPAWFALIEQCQPPVVFGEQVASRAGLAWLDLVFADMERCGYSVGAADLCAAGIGVPHLRQRLYFVAYASGQRREGKQLRVQLGQSRKRRPETGGQRVSSWATPAAHEAGGTPEGFLMRKRKAIAKGASLGESITSLSMQAQLAPWATPQVHDRAAPKTQEQLKTSRMRFEAAGKNPPGFSNLNEQAQTIVGWSTPTASNANGAREADGRRGVGLNTEATFATSKTLGPTVNGSRAPMGYRARLNPAHSRWLQGYPVEWLFAAPTHRPTPRFRKSTGTTRAAPSPDSATPSFRSSPPRSSAPRKKRARKASP